MPPRYGFSVSVRTPAKEEFSMSLVNPQPTVAVITGTGLASFFDDDVAATQTSVYPVYGDLVVARTVIVDDLAFYLVDRHRASESLRLPHMLNHASYMRHLAALGVRSIVATSAVGGISTRRPYMRVGSLVVPNDFIDLSGTPYTFAQDRFVHPTAFHRSAEGLFCRHVRDAISSGQTDVINGSVLACALRGPRFETPAEIAIFNRVYAVDLLGMSTAVPEAILAREASIHYGVLCTVTDMPLRDGDVDGAAVKAVMDAQQERIRSIVLNAVRQLSRTEPGPCPCTAQPSVFDVIGEQSP